MGWPSATAPPHTLTFVGSNPKILLFAKLTAANAYSQHLKSGGKRYLIDFPFGDIFDF